MIPGHPNYHLGTDFNFSHQSKTNWCQVIQGRNWCKILLTTGEIKRLRGGTGDSHPHYLTCQKEQIFLGANFPHGTNDF